MSDDNELRLEDMVAETVRTEGTGALTPTGAVPGYRTLAAAGLGPGARFHYALAHVARPGEWETGEARVLADGRVERVRVITGAAGTGVPVALGPGIKTLAVTMAGERVRAIEADAAASAAALRDALAAQDDALAAQGAAQDAALTTGLAAADARQTAALAAGLAGRQPVSTAHAASAAFQPGDTLTARRADGWVNVPASATIQRQAGGAFFADAALGIGTATPTSRLHLVQTGGVQVTLSTGGNSADSIQGLVFRDRLIAGSAGQVGARVTCVRPGTGSAFQLRLATAQNGEDAVDRWTVRQEGHLRPAADNAYAIGSAAERVSQIFAATGTIATSDARDKAWAGPVAADPAMVAAARTIGRAIGRYQWKDAVAAKGAAGARVHVGVTAQGVARAMVEAGLEARPGRGARGRSMRHAMLCIDAPEDRGTPGSGTDGARGGGRRRWGVRHDQLALFLIAGLEARLSRLEAAQPVRADEKRRSGRSGRSGRTAKPAGPGATPGACPC